MSTGSFGRLDRPPSLLARVQQLLRQAIAAGTFADGRLPTEVELARQLGVSRETVRLAADALQKEGLLVKVRRRGTFLQAPVLPDMLQPAATSIGYLQAGYQAGPGQEEAVSRHVSAMMLQGALEEASAAGFRLVVQHAPAPRLADALRRLQQEQRLAGLIFAHCGEEKLLRRAEGLGLPTVLLDHDLELARIPSVRDDSYEGARLALRHLIDLGHRRIAFVNWRQEELNPWRREGYRQGLRDARLAPRRAWEISVPLTLAGARSAVQRFLALAPRPSALYCFNNALADLVRVELERRGLTVPGDVSVLGGGGEEIGGLTCHQADWHGMGRTAVRLLLQPAGTEAIPPAPVLCPHELRAGETTGPAA